MSSNALRAHAQSLKVVAPRKKDFRQRAHCNPLTDGYLNYPISPDHVDWSEYFPAPPTDSESTDQVEKLMASPWNTIDCRVVYDTSGSLSPALNGRLAYEDPTQNWPNVQTGPKILDIGCGYGGASLRMAEAFPDKCVLGMEIREKVTEFVGYRIRAGRMKVQLPPLGDTRPDGYEQPDELSYCNVSVIRQNAMKFLPHYIRKGSIEKIIFAFPDPNFKKCKWRRRIINPCLLSQYAFCLQEGGKVYSITDCYELHEWMVSSLKAHPLFRIIYESAKPEAEMPRHAYDAKKDLVLEDMDEAVKQKVEFTAPWEQDFGPALKDDPVPGLLTWATEEGQKVLRNKMRSFVAVFERIK